MEDRDVAAHIEASRVVNVLEDAGESKHHTPHPHCGSEVCGQGIAQTLRFSSLLLRDQKLIEDVVFKRLSSVQRCLASLYLSSFALLK